MSGKQTKCPECSSIYRVTVTQLTAAQGLVWCPKCSATFNALTHLVQTDSDHESVSSYKHDQFKNNIYQRNYENSADIDILDIFNRRVEHSNIDLTTYLNNLNYFSTDQISTIPTLNLAEDNNFIEDKKINASYYTVWGVINFFLITILAFQILMFNPKFINNNSVLKSAYEGICQLFKCESSQEQYNHIVVSNVKYRAVSSHTTQFKGVIINHFEKSVEVPLLRISLFNDAQERIYSHTFTPNEYLIDSLVMIERIPKNSPFKFEITVPFKETSFNNYKFEIIHP